MTIANANPGRVRVTTSDGQSFVLRDASISGDSVTGIDEKHDRIAIPAATLTDAETKRLDPGKTFIAVVAVVFVGAGVFLLALSRSGLAPRR